MVITHNMVDFMDPQYVDMDKHARQSGLQNHYGPGRNDIDALKKLMHLSEKK